MTTFDSPQKAREGESSKTSFIFYKEIGWGDLLPPLIAFRIKIILLGE